MKMLRQRRKEVGLTMKQLGGIVGVSEAAISQYETGKRQADFEMQLKLSDALSCSVDYLLRGSSDFEKEKKPTPVAEDELDAQIIQLILELPKEQKRNVLDYVRFLSERSNKQ